MSGRPDLLQAILFPYPEAGSKRIVERCPADVAAAVSPASLARSSGRPPSGFVAKHRYLVPHARVDDLLRQRPPWRRERVSRGSGAGIRSVSYGWSSSDIPHRVRHAGRISQQKPPPCGLPALYMPEASSPIPCHTIFGAFRYSPPHVRYPPSSWIEITSTVGSRPAPRVGRNRVSVARRSSTRGTSRYGTSS